MADQKTCLLAPVVILWKTLEHYGVDAAGVFAEVGITAEMLKEPGARAYSTVGDHMWRKATELIKDPCFGLTTAEFWHPSYLNALGYAWLASATLREAVLRLERYIHIISKLVELEVDETGEGLSVFLRYKPVLTHVKARTDAFFAVLMSMCRVNYGKSLDPISVSFIHDEPSCSGKYFEMFRAPVYFGSDKNCLTLPGDKVDEPLEGYHPELARIHDQIIITYLASLEKGDIVNRVKSAVIKELPSGRITDEIIADKLNTSARSLQRYLRNEGTTFSKVCDAVRAELAKDYVRDQGMSLSEVAFILGFSEQSAFSRAFKRWTGLTPSEARGTA
ncbi:MAG: AraC family transcriptional regulator [Deltaproteobacteria bacterium]|nr:AraC family transcriptional regulator [Deltaproteobacteria bacterium]